MTAGRIRRGSSIALITGRRSTARIWQRDQFVEFNLDDDEFPRGAARRLAGSRSGQPFFIEAMTDPEVVIVMTYVNEQPWVIMSRIGYNA